jgi:hypothetical protein
LGEILDVLLGMICGRIMKNWLRFQNFTMGKIIENLTKLIDEKIRKFNNEAFPHLKKKLGNIEN